MERIPINEKYSLTIQEASEYFSIGVKKMRRLAEDNVGMRDFRKTALA